MLKLSKCKIKLIGGVYLNKIALLERIEELRQLMHYLITKEKDLLNTEIIKVSQQLDLVINEYNRLASY